MDKKIFITGIVLMAFSLLHPVEVKKKEVRDFSGFEKGTFRDTGVKDSGELFLSLKSSRMKGPGKEYYLGADISEKGDLYLGTGHNAALYRIGKDGKVTEMFSAQEPEIYAVLAGSGGTVYAGSSPRGKLFLVSGTNKSKEFFNPDEKYIWDLKEDRAGNIICAVGGSGGVYRIDKSGNSRKLFSGDSHILSLFIEPDNSIIAGSGGSGILYRIRSGKSRVLCDSPFDEINGITGDNEGNIWFSASKEIEKPKPGSGGAISLSAFSKKKNTPGDRSALYLRHSGGEVEEMWSSPDETIYSLAPDRKSGGVLIGTGNRGRIYRVKKDGSYSLIYEGESAQTFRILPGSAHFTVIYNNTSSIVKLDNYPASRGSYRSEVFNLGVQSSAGRLYWDALPGGTNSATLFVRSGNTSSPDSTWTEWSPPFNDRGNSTIQRSGYKYFQVRVNLISTPSVKNPGITGFRFYYNQKNLKPRVRNIRIRFAVPNRETAGSKKPAPVRKNTLNITWSGDDPNKDELQYSLYLKKINGKHWINFRKDLKAQKTGLNTELYEDGDYVLKIVADDSPTNSPATFRRDTLISRKFTIDSTAPVLTDFTASGGQIAFNVKDASSVISRVQYSLDGKKWSPLDPVDGICDSGSEGFRVSAEILKSERIIFFKIEDECKNSKVFQKEI